MLFFQFLRHRRGVRVTDQERALLEKAVREIRSVDARTTLVREGEGTRLSTFLIDVFCLGVKDVTFKWIGAEEFSFFVEKMGAASPLVPVDPSYGRRLLRDAATGLHRGPRAVRRG